VTYPFDFRPQ